MQRRLQVAPTETQCPTELSDGIAKRIQDDLNGLKWKPRQIQLYAADLYRFLTSYATDVNSLAHVLKILRDRPRRPVERSSRLKITGGTQFRKIIPSPPFPVTINVKLKDVREALYWILWDQAASKSTGSDCVNINLSLRCLINVKFVFYPWNQSHLTVGGGTGSYQGNPTTSGTTYTILYQCHERFTIPPTSYFLSNAHSVLSNESTLQQRPRVPWEYVDWTTLRGQSVSTHGDGVSGESHQGPPPLLEPPVILDLPCSVFSPSVSQ